MSCPRALALGPTTALRRGVGYPAPKAAGGAAGRRAAARALVSAVVKTATAGEKVCTLRERPLSGRLNNCVNFT